MATRTLEIFTATGRGPFNLSVAAYGATAEAESVTVSEVVGLPGIYRGTTTSGTTGFHYGIDVDLQTRWHFNLLNVTDTYYGRSEPWTANLLDTTGRVTANVDQIAGSSTAASTIAAMNAAFKTGTVDTSTFTATTTVFETSRTDNSDEYTAQALLWTSGANAGLTSRILSYTFSANSKDKLTLAAATPNTPANGDTFYILGRIE